MEINITGISKDALDSACYRLKQPSGGDDMPWVRSATLTLRKGAQPVLEIRSNQVIHEPILAVAVHVACGQEIVREYILLPSPAREATAANSLETSASSTNAALLAARTSADARYAEKAGAASVFRKESSERVPARTPRRVADSPKKSLPKPAQLIQPAILPAVQPTEGLSDRLTLSSGGEAGEPSLRLSGELATFNDKVPELTETQREVLRLEFRMLLALQSQALTQLEASEKLRNLDQALLDLQKNAAPQAAKETAPAAPVPVPPVVPEEASLFEEWGLYFALALAGIAVFGWLYWKNRQSRESDSVLPAEFVHIEPESDPVDLESRTEVEPLAVASEVAEAGAGPIDVDLHLDDADPTAIDVSLAEFPAQAVPENDGMLESATVDERFEANPVMELADIMLSFGRVKGAAQALQEYIDANPQEALQPWMRLLEVYRMAGMRQEFDDLALNLNKNFNVEIPQWEKPVVMQDLDQGIDFVLDDIPADPPVAPKAEHIEEMPRILQRIIEHWTQPDFSTFIYELLRDNRGGARVGFSMGVVEEMLFLIELKETLARMALEAEQAADNSDGG